MSDPMPSTSTTTSTGLTPNLAGALSYVLGPITGVLFLLLEKDNAFVRFHAMQSIILGILWIVVSFALSIVSGVVAMVPVLGWIVALLVSFGLSVIGLILWIVLMLKAWQGQEWEAPIAGPMARRQVAR
jgi:uncharacterized membrane protein